VTNLSQNFTLEQLTHSQTAVRLGIRNLPTPAHKERLKLLCEQILEPLHEYFPKLEISSGYRSRALNVAVGGSDNSQHSKAEAVDFSVQGLSPLFVCQQIIRLKIVDFDQLIYEGTWVHISRSENPRRQVLTAHFKKGQKPTYTQGLPKK
jgi:putative chitinase